MEVNPLNIFFVKSDSKGDRLLFRYPYTSENKDENKQKKFGRHNPYAINCTEDLLQNTQTQTSNICKGESVINIPSMYKQETMWLEAICEEIPRQGD